VNRAAAHARIPHCPPSDTVSKAYRALDNYIAVQLRGGCASIRNKTLANYSKSNAPVPPIFATVLFLSSLVIQTSRLKQSLGKT
jgi:hypothetical protein